MRRARVDAEVAKRKFGKLKPLRIVRRAGKIRWLCRCDCGREVDRLEYTLVNGRATSCGCEHPRRKTGASHSSWKGAGELTGHYYAALRVDARRRDIAFDVDVEWLWELFLRQDRRCALTGLSLRFAGGKEREAGLAQTASLDRKDSSRPYVPDNVQWVHADVNRMKNHFTEDWFFEICRRVAAKHPHPDDAHGRSVSVDSRTVDQ
jgi:hypothetical protein